MPLSLAFIFFIFCAYIFPILFNKTVLSSECWVLAGCEVHTGPVCLPGPDCKLSQIEPDFPSGFRILGDILSDSVLHLVPVNGQMEVTIDTPASLQECCFIHCKAMDEADRHTDIYGLPASLGQTASEADSAQFSRLLGPEKTFCVSVDHAVTVESASSDLVVTLVERNDRPVSGTICKRSDDLYRCIFWGLGSPLGLCNIDWLIDWETRIKV